MCFGKSCFLPRTKMWRAHRRTLLKCSNGDQGLFTMNRFRRCPFRNQDGGEGCIHIYYPSLLLIAAICLMPHQIINSCKARRRSSTCNSSIFTCFCDTEILNTIKRLRKVVLIRTGVRYIIIYYSVNRCAQFLTNFRAPNQFNCIIHILQIECTITRNTFNLGKIPLLVT